MSTQEEKFIQKIRDVFDAHEDASADAGWADLRKKYPEKDKRPLVFWLSMLAAIVFLAAGLWYLSPGSSKNGKGEQNVHNPGSVAIPKQSLGKLNNSIEGVHAKEQIPGSSIPADVPLPIIKETHLKKTGVGVNKITRDLSVPLNRPVPKLLIPKPLNVPERLNEQKQAMAKPDVGVQGSTKPSAAPLLTDSAAKAPLAAPAAQAISVTVVQKPAISSTTDTAEKKETVKSKRQLPLDFYASGYISYARGSSGRLNGGVGTAVDIRLSKSFSLNTGLAINQTHLYFSNGLLPTTPSGQAFDQFYSKPSNLPGSTITSSTSSIDVKLLSLDMPVKLKYMFSRSKHALFISAGTSAGMFLDEVYMYNNIFTSNNPQANALSMNTSTERFSENAGNFNAAHVLTFSGGLAYKLGVVEKLHIEPFIKLPIAGMGSRHIYYGSAGFNIKLSINNSPPVSDIKR